MSVHRIENIPEPVRHLTEAVSRPVFDMSPRSLRRASSSGREIAPNGASLSTVNRSDDFLFIAAGVSTRLPETGANARALVNAYSQVIADPRPDLTQLAKWQAVSSSGLRPRYNAVHVVAIRHVMSQEPLVDATLDPLPGVFDEDLKGVSPAIDAQFAVRAEMRARCGEEMEKLFGSDPQAVVLSAAGLRTSDLRRYRLIADLGDALRVTLFPIEPALAEQYSAWVYKLETVREAVVDVKHKPKARVKANV